MRPGQSPDGSVLLPARKIPRRRRFAGVRRRGRLHRRGTAWNEKGQFKLALPALDLPVSRTGLLVYHPPLFKVTPEPGSFRTEAYEEPLPPR